MQAILEAIKSGQVAAEVAVVISNRTDAPALARAAAAGVPTHCLVQRDFPDRASHHTAIADLLSEYGVDLVVTAGFNRILEPVMIRRFPDRIINIHPSLLPAFGGTLQAQAEALAHGVKISGCTVHLVDEEVDAGPIVAQAAVPVNDDDTTETLSARILAEEHRLLPQVIQWFASGRIQRQGRQVRLVASATPADQLDGEKATQED